MEKVAAIIFPVFVGLCVYHMVKGDALNSATSAFCAAAWFSYFMTED